MVGILEVTIAMKIKLIMRFSWTKNTHLTFNFCDFFPKEHKNKFFGVFNVLAMQQDLFFITHFIMFMLATNPEMEVKKDT